jgi:heme-degrading monooxygenase HmoA
MKTKSKVQAWGAKAGWLGVAACLALTACGESEPQEETSNNPSANNNANNAANNADANNADTNNADTNNADTNNNTANNADSNNAANNNPNAQPDDDLYPATGECARGTLEPDFAWAYSAGPGWDAEAGALKPDLQGPFVVATTWLNQKTTPEALARFGELMGPVVGALQAQPGLLVVRLGQSSRCGTARTLTVWEDEASMYRFVVGEGHMAAIQAVDEVSRGGSATTHWEETDPAQAASPDKALSQLAAYEGPFY